MKIVSLVLWIAIGCVMASALLGCKKPEQKLRQDTNDDGGSFAGVKHQMLKLKIDRILNLEGERFAPHGWPTKLGDVAGYEEGDFVVGPNEPIEWVVWRIGGEHKWIAAGFVNLQHGGIMSCPTVVIRKSGRMEPLPE